MDTFLAGTRTRIGYKIQHVALPALNELSLFDPTQLSNFDAPHRSTTFLRWVLLLLFLVVPMLAICACVVSAMFNKMDGLTFFLDLRILQYTRFYVQILVSTQHHFFLGTTTSFCKNRARKRKGPSSSLFLRVARDTSEE